MTEGTAGAIRFHAVVPQFTVPDHEVVVRDCNGLVLAFGEPLNGAATS